jgi:hypothetical protein
MRVYQLVFPGESIPEFTACLAGEETLLTFGHGHIPCCERAVALFILIQQQCEGLRKTGNTTFAEAAQAGGKGAAPSFGCGVEHHIP